MYITLPTHMFLIEQLLLTRAALTT